MSTGSAVQTKLQFEKKGPHDIANGKAKIGHAAKRNEDEIEFENQEAKRAHLQPEFQGNNNMEQLRLPNNTPQSSDSTGSMYSSDSTNTVIDLSGRGSRVQRTQMRSDDDDDMERVKIVRLERLKDKEDRYSSHIAFLKECIEANVIPKGLRIDLEPSIGNTDETFCEKWYKRLHEFSIILMKDVIEHSEAVETATAAKITTDTADLKKTLPLEDQKEVFDQMTESGSKRRQRLALTKKKKLTYLRYNRPERDNERRDNPRRPERQRNTEHREPRYADRRSDNHARRDRDFRPNRVNYEREDHRWEARHPQQSELDGERSRRDLADNTRTQQGHQCEEDRPTRSGTRYRDVLRGSRPNSRHSILKRASATNLSRRNSNSDTRPRTNPKDDEIKRLREQLSRLENDGSKNDKRPTMADPPNTEGAPPDGKQVLEFIATTMKALEAFKIQFQN